jgi:hypothetical protein
MSIFTEYTMATRIYEYGLKLSQPKEICCKTISSVILGVDWIITT